MKSGVVEHHGVNATVSTNHPRPLWQAVKAIRDEYGWIIDFEDPPYSSKYDLADDTDPKWRANHPNSPGVWRIAGGSFKSEFPETATTVPSSPQIEKILKKIVSDYNASGNPGRFAVRRESPTRYSIVGVSSKTADGNDQSVSSILDVPISLSVEKRTAVETIYLILSTLSATGGVKVLPLMVPTNAMQANDITVGGNGIPARTLLLETLKQSNKKRTLVWDLFFDPDTNTNAYLLNIETAVRNTQDSLGHATVRYLPHIE
jgi:hypothetical protein